MKTHNENLTNLSKHIASGNIEKSRETAERLTRPSRITHTGSALGIAIGSGLLLGGLAGVVFGKAAIGTSSLIAGTMAVVTNAINLKKQQ